MKAKYLLPQTFEGKLSHVLEECGEVLVEIGKIQRFGLHAKDEMTGIEYNNKAALISELSDLKLAIAALERSIP